MIGFWFYSGRMLVDSSIDLHLLFAASTNKNGTNFFFGKLTEVLSTSHNTNWDVVLIQLCLSCTRAHSLDSMCDESVTIATTEGSVMLLKIGLCRLAFVTNGHGNVLKEVARWARFEQVSASLIDWAHEEAHSEGSLRWMARLGLRLLTNDRDQTLTGMLRSIDVGIVQAGVAHELGEEASIGGHAWDADAHVSVDLKDLFLVHSQVMRALFQSNQNLKAMISWLTNRYGNKICLLTTWESDLRPREVEPCLTASFA